MGLLAAGVLVCMLVENSRFGLALLAIRQNELAAEAAGINARQWKMRALITSGTIAAAAGGLYACVLLVVTPDSVFGMLVSAQPVVVTLFGGVASIWGPVIGAAILVPLAESLNAELGNIIPGIQGVVYGAAIIVIMLGRAGRAVLDHPRPLVPPRIAAAAPCPARRIGGRARLCRSQRIRAAAAGGRPVALVRRSARGQPGELLGRAWRDPRHHRPERRRQDHAVQRAERRAAGR